MCTAATAAYPKAKIVQGTTPDSGKRLHFRLILIVQTATRRKGARKARVFRAAEARNKRQMCCTPNGRGVAQSIFKSFLGRSRAHQGTWVKSGPGQGRPPSKTHDYRSIPCPQSRCDNCVRAAAGTKATLRKAAGCSLGKLGQSARPPSQHLDREYNTDPSPSIPHRRDPSHQALPWAWPRS